LKALLISLFASLDRTAKIDGCGKTSMIRRAKLIGGGTAVTMMIAAVSMTAIPASADPALPGAQVYQVGNRHGNWNNNHWRYNNWRGNNNYWVGPAIGFGTGLFLGTILAQPRYYAPPGYYGPQYYSPAYDNQDSYCHSKYRSYNSYTRTFTGYDGRQHYCVIP
jgi:BA14K-like protein